MIQVFLEDLHRAAQGQDALCHQVDPLDGGDGRYQRIYIIQAGFNAPV